MKRTFFLILWFASSICLLHAQDTLPLRYARTITAAELREHLYTLASEEFEGRGAGSKGLDKAGNYIAEEFRASGLERPVIGGKQTFRQEFALTECRWKDQRMAIDGEELRVGKDFLFLSDPVELRGEFPVVFAGFAIEDSVYSDFGEIEVQGKIMLAFSGEPRDEDGNSCLTGTKEQSRKGYYFSKAAMAANKGAEGVFIISRSRSDYKNFLRSRDYYDPKPYITYPLPDEETTRLRQAFSAYINIRTAARLVDRKPKLLMTELKEMQSTRVTAAGKFGGKVFLDAASDCGPLPVANIIGIVEGTDLKHEAVVVVAHYDHLGRKGEEVFYGADDNASGTAAVLEIAEAFAEAAAGGMRPRRTVIFIAATAEELGLYGSRYYSEQPVIPLDSTYACVNIDMIGRASTRLKNSTDYLAGTAYVSEKILDFSRQGLQLAAPGLEDRMEYKEGIRGGSDHYYFARAGIPSLFYFEGFHPDYHETTDTADRILYDRMEMIVRAIFVTAWELANREERLEIRN